MSDDDTPEGEWDHEAPTLITGDPIPEHVEEVTKPHDLGPVLHEARQAGCEACYAEGQQDALVALRSLLYERGLPDDEVVAIVEAVKARLVRL